jgi:hypothetical protein
MAKRHISPLAPSSRAARASLVDELLMRAHSSLTERERVAFSDRAGSGDGARQELRLTPARERAARL